MSTSASFVIRQSTDWPNVEYNILQIVPEIQDIEARKSAAKILRNIQTLLIPTLSRIEVIDRQRKTNQAKEHVDQINATLLMLDQLISFQLLMQ